ncbi:LytR family transcriptional regulator, partial [Streptomyces hydrogenans]
MDAHSRGRADEIDPADQWVLNPQTGNYELRLDHSAGQSPTAGSRSGSTGSGTTGPSTRSAARPTAPAENPVPGQRRRRPADQDGQD